MKPKRKRIAEAGVTRPTWKPCLFLSLLATALAINSSASAGIITTIAGGGGSFTITSGMPATNAVLNGADAPAVVRFTGLAGHFSTWGVVLSGSRPNEERIHTSIRGKTLRHQHLPNHAH
jgi:hypothetical protein